MLQPLAWSRLSQRYMALCKREMSGFYCSVRFKRKENQVKKICTENIVSPKKKEKKKALFWVHEQNSFSFLTKSEERRELKWD